MGIIGAIKLGIKVVVGIFVLGIVLGAIFGENDTKEQPSSTYPSTPVSGIDTPEQPTQPVTTYDDYAPYILAETIDAGYSLLLSEDKETIIMSIPDSSPQSVRSGVIQAINAITYAYHQNNGNTPGFYTIYLYETYFDGSVRLVGHTWISESDMKLRAEGGMAGRIDVQNRCIAGVEQ